MDELLTKSNFINPFAYTFFAGMTKKEYEFISKNIPDRLFADLVNKKILNDKQKWIEQFQIECNVEKNNLKEEPSYIKLMNNIQEFLNKN